ncbi:glycosyltransferase family 1 protein [Acidocella sp. C78]|uniref:glycosyltransferase family 4 protein n=1 Tax=Acidocella sp. C78 TaxID=1671486 RepID=UPI00191B9D37|nr:glycosyltransferase family 1 protein [Acidocella sp. C78]
MVKMSSKFPFSQNLNKIRHRQLLVDVSAICRIDINTGIQRVVREVLIELFKNELFGYRIEPVYAGSSHGYRYARRFTAKFLGFDPGSLYDDPVEVWKNDVFWGLDLSTYTTILNKNQIFSWKKIGVKIVFTVYDLMPVLHPETTLPIVTENHRVWLETISNAHGLLAISQTVMNDLRNWLNLFHFQKNHEIKLGWAHLGANIHSLKKNRYEIFNILQKYNLNTKNLKFLMVGTIELRKAHGQVIDAFEHLWASGMDIQLVIVGRPDWKTDIPAVRIRKHPEFQRRLIWIESPDDNILENIYKICDCLIAASINEGFGLPLIEAAMRDMPIIARDIPVFREVAGDNAFYFSGSNSSKLENIIRRWTHDYEHGSLPNSSKINFLKWEQSTKIMLDFILMKNFNKY